MSEVADGSVGSHSLYHGQLSGRGLRNIIRSRIFRIERVGEHFVIGYFQRNHTKTLYKIDVVSFHRVGPS